MPDCVCIVLFPQYCHPEIGLHCHHCKRVLTDDIGRPEIKLFYIPKVKRDRFCKLMQYFYVKTFIHSLFPGLCVSMDQHKIQAAYLELLSEHAACIHILRTAYVQAHIQYGSGFCLAPEQK